MQFSLPSDLQQKLLAYDPTLKKLAREQKQSSPKAKPKYPLGNVNNLIPFHIVPADKQQDASDFINSRPANQRVFSFRKLRTQEVDGVIQTIEYTYAVIYHFESLWVAVWLPGPDDNYIYGYAHAYKDTETARNMVPHHKVNLHTDDNMKFVKYGRSEFRVCHIFLDREHLSTMRGPCLWIVPQSWGKGASIYSALTKFESELQRTIPIWTDSNNMFDRVQCLSIAHALKSGTYIYTGDIYVMNPDHESDTLSAHWQPTFQTIKNIITHIDNVCSSQTSSEMDSYRRMKHILPIIDTPFIRRWIQARLDECITAYRNPDNNRLANIRQPWNQIRHYLNHISTVHSIWPDCPIDYYQNHAEIMLQVDPYQRVGSEGQLAQWLRKHMPVASYFKIISKFYYEQLDEMVQKSYLIEHMKSSSTGKFMFRMHEWRDTLSMLNTLLDNGKDVEPPKRWRITEFHDTLQAETWKIRHPNASLPQDLFPEPIRVETNNIRWSFFQPVDTHQLASWGQAVRNCVGSAKDYAEGVRKKKHFIVLCMVDGKPQFTVQLDVNHGVMNVKQIAGLSNARLTEEQRDQYTEAFKQALQARNNQLTSA